MKLTVHSCEWRDGFDINYFKAYLICNPKAAFWLIDELIHSGAEADRALFSLGGSMFDDKWTRKYQRMALSSNSLNYVSLSQVHGALVSPKANKLPL